MWFGWFRRKPPKEPGPIAINAPGPFRKGTPTGRRTFFQQTAGIFVGAAVASKVKLTGNKVPAPHVTLPPPAPSGTDSPSGTWSCSCSISPSPSGWFGDHGESE